MLRGEPVIRKVVDEPAPESRRASVPHRRAPGAAAAAGRWGRRRTAGLTRVSLHPATLCSLQRRRVSLRGDDCMDLIEPLGWLHGAAARDAVAAGLARPSGRRPGRFALARLLPGGEMVPVAAVPPRWQPVLDRIAARPPAGGRGCAGRPAVMGDSECHPGQLQRWRAPSRPRARDRGRAGDGGGGRGSGRCRRREHPARALGRCRRRRSGRACCRWCGRWRRRG